MADRWSKYTISEIREQDLKSIEGIMSITNLGDWYETQLKDMYIDVSEQLGKAVGIGKIMQAMLLEYMPAAELKARLRDAMLKVRVTEARAEGE